MIQLRFVEADGAIPDPVRLAIRAQCDVNEPALRDLLPALTDQVLLTVSSGRRVIPETGCVGSAQNLDEVHVIIDPDRLESVVEHHFKAVLFHEFHHLVRGWVTTREALPSYLEAAICEGLATAFERDFAGSSPPWGAYPHDVMSWVEEIAVLDNTAPYEQWMFQHPDGRRWIGYRAGTFIVDEATNRSGLDAALLVTTPFLEVLALSGLGSVGT